MKYIKLFEAVSDITYHFTNQTRIDKILETNTIYLTSVLGTDSDQKINSGYLYYLSVTSSKSTELGYGASFNGNQLVRITFNGRMLNSRFKSKRVDYWGMPKDPNEYISIDKFSKSHYKHISRQNEMEDRILSNNNKIENANKYIAKIEVLNGSNNTHTKYLADKLNIPIYFYDDKKYFDYSITKHAIKVEAVKKEDSNDEIKFRYNSDLVAYLIYKDAALKDKIIAIAKEHLNTERLEKLLNDIQYRKEKLDYYLNNTETTLNDQTRYLKSIIHNSRRDYEDKFYTIIVHEFGKDMKKNNCNTIKEYLEYKFWIGKKSQKEFNKIFISEINQKLDSLYEELKDRLNSYDYYDSEGYSNREIFRYESSVNKFFDSIIKQMKLIYSNYILTNDDMYRYNYLIGESELKKKLNIDYSIIDANINYNKDSFKSAIHYLISDMDSFIYDTIMSIREEYLNQFN